MGIAKHTGIWCSACDILFYKIFNHKIPELVTYVEDIMSKAMFHGSLSCIIEGVQVTTARFFFASAAGGIVPGLHGDANHFISLVMKH